MTPSKQSVIPDAVALIESWERAASGREQGEPVEPPIDWSGIAARSLLWLYLLAAVVSGGYWVYECVRGVM